MDTLILSKEKEVRLFLPKKEKEKEKSKRLQIPSAKGRATAHSSTLQVDSRRDICVPE